MWWLVFTLLNSEIFNSENVKIKEMCSHLDDEQHRLHQLEIKERLVLGISKTEKNRRVSRKS
jgi:hypothetical protein